MSFPQDRTFVDDARKIVDQWHRPLMRLDEVIELLTPANIVLLRQLLAAVENPDDAAALANAFASITAYNDETQAAGGIIEALQAGDNLSLLVRGGGSVATDPALRALAISIYGASAAIAGTGAYIAPVNVVTTINGTATKDLVQIAAIDIPSRRIITGLSWEKSASGAGSGCSFAMNLYEDATLKGNRDSKPGIKIVDGGQASVGDGTTGIRTLAVNADLDGGRYWIAWSCDTNGAKARMVDSTTSAHGVDGTGGNARGYRRSATWPGMTSDETESVWTADFTADFPLMFMS